MPNQPKDFPIFEKLGNDQLTCKVNDLLQPLEFYTPSLGMDWNNIRYNKKQILEIIDLVERRRVYFWIYHQIEMGELNEACLICFWILKFNPFYDSSNPNKKVNIVFAMALYLRMVCYVAKKRDRNPNITRHVFKHIQHAFVYRDLSKESLMAIAEGLIG